MAENQTQQSQDAQNAARTAAKVSKKIAAKKAAKGASKKAIKGLLSGPAKAAIISLIVPFITIVAATTVLIVLPSSVVGAISDMTTKAADDLQAWFDEVQTSFSATAISVFDNIEGFFDDVYSFFTGDTTEDDLENQIVDLILYGGRNPDGEKTDYGESINGETAIIYKYFLDEYVDVKRQAESGLPPVVETEGNDYLEEHGTEIPAAPSLPEDEVITDGDTSYTRTYTIDNSGEITIVGQYEGDDMGDFFKPVFYLLASNSLDQYDREKDDYAMNSLVILANDVASDIFEVIPSEPAGITWELTLEPPNTITKTQTATYHLVLNIPYRIGTTTDSINKIITEAGNDPVDDATAIKSVVENMCAFYGAELLPDAAEDGWGLVSFSAPITSGASGTSSNFTSEEIKAILANIDFTGCPDNAIKVLQICQNIDQYAINSTSNTPIDGKVRIQKDYCMRAIADIFMCAFGRENRPSFDTALGVLSAWPACKTSGSPPYSGFAVAGDSPYAPGIGHIAIYFKTTDGQEYIIESVLGKVNVETFANWKTIYQYGGYTGFGFFGTEYSSYSH